MARASASSKAAVPRRLPRGRHALAPEEVLRDQRRRLIAAVPGVVAKHGYAATSVAHIVKAAAVSRNAFYENFADKEECFAVAHDAGHERLFGVLSQPCEAGGTVEERAGASLMASLAALAAEPDMARMLFVEAPGAGEKIALRYYEWLGRYGALLRAAAPETPARSLPAPEVESVIVGGIASRIASEVLQGRAGVLPVLTAPLVEYALAFFRLGEPDPKEGELVTFERGERSADDPAEPRRKPASA